MFAAVAALLAALGLYGVLAHAVVQQRREIGIRMAMGALPRNILRFVLRQAGVWVIAGLGIGLACSGLMSLVLRSRVYGISVWHPGSFALGLFMIGIAVLAACLVPAFRALRISPMEALRNE